MHKRVLTLTAVLVFLILTGPVYSAWVSPNGNSDPSGQWTNEGNAHDDNDGTYASNNPGSGGYPNKWGGFIVLTFPSAISTDRFRVKADFGPPGVDRVDIDVYNGSWNDAYEGTILNAAWDEKTFTQVDNVTQARFRFRYDSHYIYWLFEFDLWEVVPITIPSVTTQSPTSVEENSAILHGQLTDDGGEPCDYRFQYGTTDSYGSNTTWRTGAVSTGDSFGEVVTGLTQGQTYHYRAQVRNSAGVSSGSDVEFFTGAPSSGWVTPTGNSDPNGEWDDETFAHDDELDSYSDSYHNINDPDGQWSFYLHLTHPSITSDKVRFYAKATDIDRVDIDVYDGSSWTGVYEGSFSDMSWVQQSFSQQSVEEARIRFRVDANNKGLYWELYEFDFWRLSSNAPTLSWTGETNYSSDGLDPEVGCDSTPFEFRVEYTDADNNAPATIQLYLDKNGDNDYIDTGEVIDMSLAADAAASKRDGDYTNGEIFTVTTTIPYGPNTNNCSYYFAANDGTSNATGAPTSPTNAPDVLRGIGVFMGDDNPGDTNETQSSTGVEMLQVKLIADDVEDVLVTDLRLDPTGTGHDRFDLPSTTPVEIYRDENNNGTYDSGTDTFIYTRRYSGDNNNTVFDIPDQTITKGTTENWLVVYNFSPSVTDVGENYRVTVLPAQVNCQGVTSGLNFSGYGENAVSGLKTITAGTGSLTVNAGPNNPGDSSAANDAQNLVMLQLNLGASDVEDVDISSITFTASGTIDDSSDITDAELWLDVDDNGEFNDLIDTQINGAETYSADNGQVTFNGISETITAGDTEN
ncbi:MAG: hypothetical protein GF375_07300, partial [Candidatus Omnitrophica bacterium]|nr:hypothetical protein [Candidatus Omnitrophota bacterium]